VILTAKALETIEADPVAAKAAALEAVKLAPSLVPASVAAAKASFRLGDVRKGAKVLEAAWKAEPHPEIGEAYVHARPGDSTHDRLDRAKKLQSLRRNHVESALVVARAALDAGEFALARAEAEAAVRLAPREAAFLLLADIEEAETGDQGKVRQWLGRALRAPRDPAWVADGHIAERWAPASPVTGRLDAFEWRAPEERLGQLVEAGEEPAPAAPAPVKLAPPPPSAPPPPAPARPEDVEDAVVEAAPPAPSETPAPPEDVALQPVVDAEPVDEDAEPAPIRLPDDPGVTPEDAEAGKPGKFRLF
jgi:HemY protein